MAFPQVAATNTTADTSTASTSTNVALPSGLGTAGQLLVVVFRSAVAGAIGWPAGWVELIEDASDAADDVTAIAYRWTDGSETSPIAVSHGTGRACAVSARITGTINPSTQAPQLSTVAFGASATMNATTVTPTGGAKDYLWVYIGANGGEITNPPAADPENYAGTIGINTGVTGTAATNCGVEFTFRSNNAASEDPGNWSLSGSVNWTAWAMAVHPDGVVSGTGAGTVAATGSATGDHGATGTAAGATLATGSSAGDHGATGTAAGTVAPSGSAAGDHGATGTASGSTATSGSAAGEHPALVEGTGAGALSASGSATGDTPDGGVTGWGPLFRPLTGLGKKAPKRSEPKPARPQEEPKRVPAPVEGRAAGRVPAPTGAAQGRVTWPRRGTAGASLSLEAEAAGEAHQRFGGHGDAQIALAAQASGEHGQAGTAVVELTLAGGAEGVTFPLALGAGRAELALVGRGEAKSGAAGGALVALCVQGTAHGVYRDDIREDREIELLVRALDLMDSPRRRRPMRRAA